VLAPTAAHGLSARGAPQTHVALFNDGRLVGSPALKPF
jgi:hypothetical protein